MQTHFKYYIPFDARYCVINTVFITAITALHVLTGMTIEIST